MRLSTAAPPWRRMSGQISGWEAIRVSGIADVPLLRQIDHFDEAVGSFEAVDIAARGCGGVRVLAEASVQPILDDHRAKLAQVRGLHPPGLRAAMLAVFVVDVRRHHETPAGQEAIEEEMKILAEIEPFTMRNAVAFQKIRAEHALDGTERERRVSKAQLARKKEGMSTVKA